MEIGKLYKTKELYWLLYPSKDIARTAAEEHLAAADAAAAPAAAEAHAANWVNYCSKRLDCNVSYISPNSLFMLLEHTGKFCKILSTEGSIGWIILADWCKDSIEEVKSL